MRSVPISNSVLCNVYRRFYLNDSFREALSCKHSISFEYNKGKKCLAYSDPLEKKVTEIPLPVICNAFAVMGIDWAGAVSSGSLILRSMRLTPALLLGDALPLACWAEFNDNREVRVFSEYVQSLPSICSGGGGMVDYHPIRPGSIPAISDNLSAIDNCLLSKGYRYNCNQRYMHICMLDLGFEVRLAIKIYDMFSRFYPLTETVDLNSDLYESTVRVLEGISSYGLDRNGDISDVYMFTNISHKYLVLENPSCGGENMLVFV